MLYKGYYDVVILPSPRVRDYVIKLSREIRKRSRTRFVLGQQKFLPHISLYHVPVKSKDLLKFRTALSSILTRVKLGTLSTTALKRQEGDSIWASINIRKASWLKKLHSAILKGAVKFLDKDFRAAKTWGSHYGSSRQHWNLKRYGSPNVGPLYRPHITVTSLRDERVRGQAFFKFIKFKRQSFRVNSISVCQLGAHHTCHRILFTISKF